MRRRLGVNIDHIATLRQARGERYPDPLDAIEVLKACQVDQVTLHLREDRRHIQDADLARITHHRALPVNLEMAATREMVRIAGECRPDTVTFVPERRREVTTEGGLDCVGAQRRLGPMIKTLSESGIRVSLFIAPALRQIACAAELGANAIEIHTGEYCHRLEGHGRRPGGYRLGLRDPAVQRSLNRIDKASRLAAALGLKVFAGHGLHCGNLVPVTKIRQIEEYNIGHAIIARAVFIGLEDAIYEIQSCLGQTTRG